MPVGGIGHGLEIEVFSGIQTRRISGIIKKIISQ
jgi:hypothetical protein